MNAYVHTYLHLSLLLSLSLSLSLYIYIYILIYTHTHTHTHTHTWGAFVRSRNTLQGFDGEPLRLTVQSRLLDPTPSALNSLSYDA